MKQDNDGFARRSFVAGMGVGAVGLAVGATQACAQTATAFQPARHARDSWLDALPGTHRVFIDSATASGGAEALLFAANLYTARETAYADEPADFAIIVCFRHFSTPFGYKDAVWAKYGEIFDSFLSFPDPATGKAPQINLMNAADHTDLPNMGVTIDAMKAKGVQFVICSAATQFAANVIAQQTGGKADEIRDELVAGAIDGGRFVSAGVVAVTRAQEYGYSLLYAG